MCALAPAALANDDDTTTSAPKCAAALVPHPYPPRAINQIDVGYFGGPNYFETYLVGPRMVPLSIIASDTDELLVYCDGNCTRRNITAESAVDWEVIPVSGSPGALVDAAAAEWPQVLDGSCVLYMPPTDLAIGDKATARIKATVHEICNRAMDPDTLVWFDTEVQRIDEFLWEVKVSLDRVDPVYLSQAPCISMYASQCELLGPAINPNPLVTALITEFPGGGMHDGELRPIRCTAYDMDLALMECGIPVHTPPISNFANTPICDDILYTWSVVAGPGNGEFLYPDRSTLFRATLPGEVTVRVDVTTSTGEHAFSEATFTILPTQIQSMEFRNHRNLLSDKYNLLYTAPHWQDNNGNGTADDPPQVVLEQNFPVAYERSKKVEFGLVILKGMGPLAPAPMPGTQLVGTSSTVAGNTFKGPALWNALASQWACFKLDTTGTLPATIKKYAPYRIDWQLDFGGGATRALNSTAHRIYVTLDAPNDPYGPFETIYDIACGQADGADSAAAAAIMIWNYFQAGSVQRVGKDGWNQTIAPTQLRYWSALEAPLTVAGFLASPTGNGSCGSWSRLMRGVLAVHGIDSTVIGLQVPIAPAGTSSEVLVKNWTIPAGGPPVPFAQCASAGSIPAQGGVPVTNRFENHAVLYVQMFDALVDPSYKLGPYFGVPGLVQLEDAIVAGIRQNITAGVLSGDVTKHTPGVSQLIPFIYN